MEKLFSYGTLQLERVQLETFGRLLQGGTDELVGYRLSMVKITDPAVLVASGLDEHPIVQFTGNPGDRVAGTVFEITPAELAQADGYEVDDYQRVLAECASGQQAWVYVSAE